MTQLPEAALRAFLVHDTAETTRLTRQLGAEGIRDYQYLAYAALSLIAGWRFRQGYSDADIVRRVAAIRLVRIAGGGEPGLQPAVAENVLRHALGQEVPDPADHVERFRAAIVLLDALSDGALPGEEDVDHLLMQARALAGRWAANNQSLPAASTGSNKNKIRNERSGLTASPTLESPGRKRSTRLMPRRPLPCRFVCG